MPTLITSRPLIRLPAAVLVMALQGGCSNGHATVTTPEDKAQSVQNTSRVSDEDKTSDNVIRHTPLYY
ncbi:MAG: hypothetical protein ACXU8A_03010 [Burkholderiaceae bacterium]